VDSHGNYSNNEQRDDHIHQNKNEIEELRKLVTSNCRNIKDIRSAIKELNESNKTLTDAVLKVQSKVIEVDKHQRNGLKDEIVGKLLESINNIINGQSSTIQDAFSNTFKSKSDNLKYNAYEKGSVEKTKRTKWTTIGKIIRDIIAPGAILWLIIDKLVL